MLVNPGSCAPAVVGASAGRAASGWCVARRGLASVLDGAAGTLPYTLEYKYSTSWRWASPTASLRGLGDSGLLRAALDGVVREMGTIFIFAFFRHNSRLKSTPRRTVKKYGEINNWDVSKVTRMSYMFEDAESFNQPLNKWDVSIWY